MAKSSELFEHMQRYVREVFADRLREKGFTSYKGEDIHWYRLVNDEVVQAVYFVTRHTTLHAFVEIYYGCHPLYIPPIFQKSPYMYALPGYEQMNDAIPEAIPGSTPYGFEDLRLCGIYNRPYRAPDVLVMCPQDKNNGLDILEKLLPVVDEINTPLACYEMHKKRRAMEIENDSFLTMSTYFVDEVLYWEDKALYPYCKKYIDTWTQVLKEVNQTAKLYRKADKEHLERLLVLQKVFEEDTRKEYLQTLADREKRTLCLLRKDS